MMDDLRYIDGCMDGTECPDAARCREEKPESCPLQDVDFNLNPDDTLDKVIKDTY
jgi:hypothetical protein